MGLWQAPDLRRNRIMFRIRYTVQWSNPFSSQRRFESGRRLILITYAAGHWIEISRRRIAPSIVKEISMAKYEIKYLCGHSGTIQLFGKNEDRERKIKYYESHYICPDCYKEQFRVPTAGCEEVEMFYRDYKHKCPQCETKPNSYDPKKKTIIVYVPKATGIDLPDYGIEGLSELRAAIEENNAYQESFHQMMANEDNDGIYPPKTPQYSVAELMRKYPSAAAYLEAEEYSESENYAQSTIGEKALNRMRTGEDCLLVQKEMQNEWTDYCYKRILD